MLEYRIGGIDQFYFLLDLEKIVRHFDKIFKTQSYFKVPFTPNINLSKVRIQSVPNSQILTQLNHFLFLLFGSYYK